MPQANRPAAAAATAALALVTAAVVGPSPAAADPASVLASHGIAFQPEPGCAPDPSLLADLEAGLLRLPARLRTPPGGPLELQLHCRPSPLGMGDGSGETPDWTEGRRVFHLYAAGESGDRRATFRLERLEPAERESLWRRRALVHAVVQRWDDERGWSRSRPWRRLTWWLAPLDRLWIYSDTTPQRWSWAASRERGLRSPALDLVTFAEEALVPVESLRDDALAPDDSVRCQELSKSRFLRARLRELAGDPAAEQALPRGACPAFDAWARLPALEHHEVLLAAASGRAPESVFGHLLLRPVWRDHAAGGPLSAPVFQVAALVSPRETPFAYLLNGLTGGYSLVALPMTMGEVQRQYAYTEQRTLRRYRLELSREESIRLLERLWEQERRLYAEYTFFRNNCATALLHIVDGALDEDRFLDEPNLLWITPTDVLEQLGRARVRDGSGGERPLVTYLPGDIESSRARALRADGRRTELLAGLADSVPDALANRLRQLDRDAQSGDPASRVAAYAGLGLALPQALRATRGDPGPARHAIVSYLDETVASARYVYDRAEVERVALAVTQAEPWLLAQLPTTEELLRLRQSLYEREDEEARDEMVLQAAAIARLVVTGFDARALPPDLLARGEHVEAEERAWTAALDLQARVLETHLASFDLERARDAEHGRALREQAERHLRASPGSGHDGFGIGTAASLHGDAGLVRFRGAALRQRLGDLTERGFPPDVELHILDSDVLLAPRLGWPEVYRAEYVIFGLGRVPDEPEVGRTGILDHLGWNGAFVQTTHPELPLPRRAGLRGELVVPLWLSAYRGAAASLSLGGTGDLRTSWPGGGHGLDVQPAGGPTVGLQHRLPLFASRPDVVRVGARVTPVWVLDRGLELETRGTLGVEVLASRPRGLGVSVEAAGFRWDDEGEPIRWDATLSVGIELY